MGLRHRRQTPLGQAMTEAMILVALVAIATIGFVGLFGDNLRKVFGASAAAIGGQTNVATGATARAPSAERNLKNFGEANPAGTSDNSTMPTGF